MAHWSIFLTGFLAGAAAAALVAWEAHSRARRAESARLSRLAHDLRTPLSSITAYSEILGDEDETGQAVRGRFLGIIHEEALRLGVMIDQRLGSKRPVAHAPAGTDPRPARPAPPAQAPARARTILVVDDDRFIVEATRTLLASEGYEALGAAGGEEALARARSARPDLILMDLMMPDMAGDEALRRLRSDPATREIPVIITTGQTDGPAPGGAAAVLAKPVTREALLAAIARASRAPVTQANGRSDT